MAEGVRIELTSMVLETMVLAFERTLNVRGRGDGTRTHTVIGPRDFKSLAATCYATPP